MVDPEERAAAAAAQGVAEGVAVVAIVMGSRSDWETMRAAAETLADFGVLHACRVVSAHRTPDFMVTFAHEAAARGTQIIIAGAGGAAHLPGMLASLTPLPVIGVPIQSKALNGLDSLLSIVQMPAGVPVATMAIGRAGAINAALFAVSILALYDADLATQLSNYRAARAEAVTGEALKMESGS